jgi:predicted DNA-binding protein
MLTDDMRLKRTNIWLKQSSLDKLKSVSRKTMIPVSALIRKSIETYLASIEKPRRSKKK